MKMKSKRKLAIGFWLVCLGMAALLASGCQAKQQPEGGDSLPPGVAVSFAGQDLDPVVQGYLVVLNRLWTADPGLNEGIKYIAIDTSKMQNLTPQTQEQLLKVVETLGYEVLDSNSEQLAAGGYIKDGNFEEGILFELEDQPMTSEDKMVFTSVKKTVPVWERTVPTI